MSAAPVTLIDAEDEGDLLADGVHPELPRWISEGLEAIRRYAATEPFQRMYRELGDMAPQDQARFVRGVLLNPEELARRGLTPPDGIRIQRSEFGDRRPTVFCVSQALPEGALWKRITITYDHSTTHDQGGTHPAQEGGK